MLEGFILFIYLIFLFETIRAFPPPLSPGAPANYGSDDVIIVCPVEPTVHTFPLPPPIPVPPSTPTLPLSKTLRRYNSTFLSEPGKTFFEFLKIKCQKYHMTQHVNRVRRVVPKTLRLSQLRSAWSYVMVGQTLPV